MEVVEIENKNHGFDEILDRNMKLSDSFIINPLSQIRLSPPPKESPKLKIALKKNKRQNYNKHIGYSNCTTEKMLKSVEDKENDKNNKLRIKNLDVKELENENISAVKKKDGLIESYNFLNSGKDMNENETSLLDEYQSINKPSSLLEDNILTTINNVNSTKILQSSSKSMFSSPKSKNITPSPYYCMNNNFLPLKNTSPSSPTNKPQYQNNNSAVCDSYSRLACIYQ